MKIKIKFNETDYFLGFTRATAIEMGKHVRKTKNNSDGAFDNAEIMIKHSLKAYQPKLTQDESSEIAKFVLENYDLVGKVNEETGEVSEKGLISILNDILMGCMPKGFTGQATMKFEVVEE